MNEDNITQIYTNKTIFTNDAANESTRKNKIFDGIFKWISLSIFGGIVILNIIVIGLLMKRKKKSRMKFFVANLAYADRVNVIVKPLSTVTRLKTYKYGLALSTWILGSLLAIQYAVHTKLYPPQNFSEAVCRNEFPYDPEIRYFDVCALIIIPVIFIITCYIMIYMAIHRRHTCKVITTNSYSDGVHERFNFYAKMRTVKQLFVVSVVYVICWTPLICASVQWYYNLLRFGITFRVIYGLAPLNSLTNPVVFLLFNHNMFCKGGKSSNKNTTVLKTNSLSTNVKMVNATKL